MDNLDEKIVRKMNTLYESDYKERSQSQSSFKNVSDFGKLAEENKNKIQDSLKKKEDFVEGQIFAGDLEKFAHEEGLDYTHNYVYEEAEKTVTRLNESVAKKIQVFGKADIEEHASMEEEEKLTGHVNKPPKAAGFKQGINEHFGMKFLKSINKHADITTLREQKKLEKYTDFKDRMMNRDKNGKLKNSELERLAMELPESKRDKFVLRMKMEALPFFKMYKKSWTGKYYTIDGKKIEVKKGQQTPKEYNKQLLNTLALDTNYETEAEKKAGIKKDKAVIDENRKKKGKLISDLAKDLLKVKITENMLTDEYMSEHLGEMLQLAERFTAFKNIMDTNLWFLGDTKKNNINDRDIPEGNTLDNKFLAELVGRRIYQVSDYLNLFMDKHFAAHGFYRDGKFDYKKDGFILGGDPVFNVKQKLDKLEEREDAKTIKGIERSLKTVKKYQEKTKGFRLDEKLNVIQPIQLKSEAEFQNEMEQKEYDENITYAKERLDREIRKTARTLSNIYKDDNSFSDRILDKVIDPAMKDYKKKSDEKYDKEKKESDKNKEEMKYAKLPFDEYANREGGKAIAEIKDLMQQNSEMYLIYGPEIEHLYSRYYASMRLKAELSARKACINQEMKEDEKRDKSIFDYKTDNEYAGSLNDYFSGEIKKKARTAGETIDKKISFLDANAKIIEKTMKFFLMGIGEAKLNAADMKEIKGFLEKENLGHMFEITKMDQYSEVMDDVTYEMNKIITKRDNGDANPDDVKKNDSVITSQQRALNVFNIRKRIRLQEKRQKSVEDVKKQREDTPKAAVTGDVNLLFGNLTNLKNFNVRDEIKYSEKELDLKGLRISSVYEFIQLADTAGKVLKGELRNIVNIKSTKSMQGIFDTYKKYGLVKDDTNFHWYRAYTRAKCELVSEYAVGLEALEKMQSHPCYPYFDMSRITDLQDDQLKELKTVMEKKRDALKDVAGQAEQYDALKGFVEMLEQYNIYREVRNSIPVFDEQTLYNRARGYYREYQIMHAQETHNRFADEKYMQISEVFSGETTDMLNQSAIWLRKANNKRNKTKAPLPDTENILLDKTRELLELNLDKLTEDCKNLMENGDVDRDGLIDLCIAANLTLRLNDVLDKEGDKDAPDFVKDMLSILNTKENVSLKEDVIRKLTVLTPLADAVTSTLSSYGFYSDGYQNFNLKDWEKDSKKTDEEVEQEVNDFRTKAKEKFSEYQKTAGLYQSGKIEEAIAEAQEKILEDLYTSGEKLSVLDLPKWRDKIEAMTKKGFFTKDTNEKKWYRAAAAGLLSHWPYSFEQFYSRRLKKDTGKALTVTLKSLLGKDGASLMTDKEAENAGEISRYIAEDNTFNYHVLNENGQNELNRILDANKYDRNLFKYIFKRVNTSGSNIPLNEKDREAREENEKILEDLKFFVAMTSEEKEKAVKIGDTPSIGFAISDVIIDVLKSQYVKNLNQDSFTEEYIAEHFQDLYDLTRKAAFVDMMYEKHKNLFEQREKFVYVLAFDDTYKSFTDLFGTRGNKIIMRLKDMVDAYARKNFVGEDGTFDIGLTNEDIADMKDTKKDKKARFDKVVAEREKRANEFEKNMRAADAEYSRVSIAEKTHEVSQALNTIDNIKIGSQDKLFYVSNIGGHISDFGLLVYDEGLRNAMKNISIFRSLADKERENIAELKAQIKTLEESNAEVPEKLKDNLQKANGRLAGHMINAESQDNRIQDYRYKAELYYKTYQTCHDEKGRLVLEKTGTDGKKINLTDTYIDFHVLASQDMAGIFGDFANMYEKEGNKILSQDFIINQMKSKDWGKLYTDYRRFNLYASMLQKETEDGAYKKKTFLIFFSKESPQIKRLEARTGDLESKAKKKTAEVQSATKEKVAAEAKLRKAQDSMLKLDQAYTELQKQLAELMKEPEKNGKAIKKITDKIMENTINRSKFATEADNQAEITNNLSNSIKELERQASELSMQAAEHKKARENMEGVFAEHADKVDIFQEYVKQIETILMQYGISGDGDLMSDQVTKQMKGISGVDDKEWAISDAEMAKLSGTNEDAGLNVIHDAANKAFDVAKARENSRKSGKK